MGSLIKHSNYENGKEIKIPVPWGHIAGISYGNETDFPILGLHGWMNNAGTFEKIVPLLTKGYFICSIDLPGYGFSSHFPPGFPYEYTDSILAIKRIREHFKWEKFIIMGHSLGAGLGIFYSAVFPNEIDRVISIDLAKPMNPIASDQGDIENYAEKMNTSISSFLGMEEITNRKKTTYTYKEALNKLIQSATGSLNEESAKILLKRGLIKVSETEDQWSFTRDIRHNVPIINRFTDEELFNILNQVTRPLLIIKAEDSPWYQPREKCERAFEIYRSKLKIFELVFLKGGHFLHLENHIPVAETINEFLLRNISKI